MCRHVLFVLALSFILFYCVTLTRGALGTADFSGFLLSRQRSERSVSSGSLCVCSCSSVRLAVAE